MLSGIRTGKAKKKKAKKERGPPRSSDDTTSDASANASANAARKSGGGSSKSKSNAANLSVAEKLKQALASGVPLQDGGGSSRSYMERVVGGTSAAPPGNDNDNDNDTVIVLGPPGTAAAHKREEDMTASELAARERSMGGDHEHSMSWNEHMARSIVRVGKKRRIKERTAAAVDSDEEVETMKKHLPDYYDHAGSERKRNAKHLEKEERRDRLRRIDRYRKQESITSMCSWWIQSSSFAKHRLLALGKHVALMMAPPSASLEPGHQFYLVPLKHAPSMVDCDDPGVRDELGRFRKSLENMYALKGRGLVLCETVLPGKSLWQTRVEVVPVPFAKLGDAPLFFRSAMEERAAEFGTHTAKLLPTTPQKPLRSVLPKRFPYFCVDWGNLAGTATTGCAQLIESSSSSSSGFPREFGLDTLAGMMGLDPVRFRRKERFPNGFEERLVAEFAERWKAFDWTRNLED